MRRTINRRIAICGAGAAAVAASVNTCWALAQTQKPTDYAQNVISAVSSYIAHGAESDIPPDVIERAKHHILDTLAAMVSGSTLKPAKAALRFAQDQGGNPEAQVVASKLVLSAVNAAMVNGMMAHSDETDDSHRKTLVHPGASVLPAAMAMAERTRSGGEALLKGVVIGYDVGCRMILALDPDQLLQGSGATPGIGGCFGAAAACAHIARIDEQRIPFVLSYAAQQASGVNSWMRDQEHVEKAFVFAGMPARNGVTATELVQSGFTGESDPFNGPDNFFKAFSAKSEPSRLIEGTGREYEIMLTDMKRFPVGFPIQAALDATLKLITKGLTAKGMKSLTIRLPAPGVHTVDDRSMPDVNVQFIVAVTLLDGVLKFETAHSQQRMKEPAVLDIKKRIVLVEDTDLTTQKRTREANLEATTIDGTILKEHGNTRGAIEDPMSREEVENKARELMTPILGRDRFEHLAQKIWNLEKVTDVRELRPLLSA